MVGNWRRQAGTCGRRSSRRRRYSCSHISDICSHCSSLLPFRCEAQQAAGPYFPAKPGHDRAASEGPWKWAPTCGLTLWLHTVVLWLSRANKACDSAALNEAPMASAPQPALLFPPYHYLIPIFDISSNHLQVKS